MKTTPRNLRGGLRVASFFLTTLAIVLSLAGGIRVRAQSSAFTVRIRVSDSGFEPKRIVVPMGVVRFVVSATEGDHCFAIPSLDVEKRVRVSRPLEVEVPFERAGEFPFVCCAESPGTLETGVILVGR